MDSVKLAPFKATPIESLPTTASLIRTTFLTQKTKPVSYRLTQLRKLYWSIVDNTPLLLEAIKRDLNKNPFEAITGEISWLKNDIILFSKNLEKWTKDETLPYTPLFNKPLSPKVRKEPLGAVLVIGCWNFPYLLTMGPFIGAIAAGCPAVLKPSEIGPNTAMVMKKVIDDALDPDAYAVVIGGVEETTALLNEKWAKITYTGNANVGRIIMKKAAETLTPVTLELGGLSPAIVTKNADIRLAAKRLFWGKTLNAGQVCLSHNYIVIDREVFPTFVQETMRAFKEFYPEGSETSPDFGRIISKGHFNRIKKMLDESRGRILIGGGSDEDKLYIEPTFVEVDSIEDSLMKEESFGPIVPILQVSNIDEAIRVVNSVFDTPLAMYPFGNKFEVEKLLREIQSGGASINDSYWHGSVHTIPFGGIGQSGTGCWHGKASFDNFTHLRSITSTLGWLERFLFIKYPPYGDKLKLVEKSMAAKPNFDRQGRTIRGVWYWISLLFSPGGDNSKVSILRWSVVILFAVAAMKYI